MLTCACLPADRTERKSRTTLGVKQGRIYMQHNTLTEDIPICVMLKASVLGPRRRVTSVLVLDVQAMGVTDQELVTLVGCNLLNGLAPSLQEASALGIHTKV